MTATDRPILITGATSGLGMQAALRLAERHPLVLTARSNRRLAELESAIPGQTYVVCDQSSLDSVRAAAEQISGPLQAVVLAAGVQTVDTSARSSDGYELTFAVNVLAPHLLLGMLSPHAHETTVVHVGSGTHYGQFRRSYAMVPAPHWASAGQLATTRGIGGGVAYSTSKLALLHHTHELARRAPKSVVPICFDPGMMPGTELARNRGTVAQFAWKRVMPILRPLPGVSTPEVSGRNLATLALATEPRGDYVEIDRRTASSDESYDEARELELFDELNSLVGLDPTAAAPWWSGRPDPAHG
ncbi:Light-dependent protochlorophyllide reductase [Rhodococcus sp. AW25M09]|uniref:SDR family NAD(P)-dependent oxidoreductase n=1 Tax=Rhodococcus sp. AW25M09 TaxID=1268303 RepID=UPI0002AC5DDB|nr:SDR family NAD(P)-dependent oxidoreductase [Rhodococcus sp. AW25M09]CCQ13474.1 Light-dependent protochlorophyllide reductase [Rhodococcus sp. AW25M09]